MPVLEGKTPGGGRNPVYLVGNPEVFSGFALLLSQAKKVNIAAQRLPRPAGAPAGACFWLTVGQSGAARQHRV